MDREMLRFFLTIGPVLKFDVAFFTKRLLAAAGPLPEPRPQPMPERAAAASPGLLFATRRLNHCVILKHIVPTSAKSGEEENPIRTLVFFPYDQGKPQDGGESFFFSEDAFARTFSTRFERQAARLEGFASDCQTLALLDGIPAFCPFIVGLAFERAGQTIPPAYLDLAPSVRAKLTQHLKSRIRPLIIAAYRDVPGNTERAVDDLTERLFLVRNIDEIMPLVHALRLPPEQAVELVQSWIGIAYFEYEYSRMQSTMKQFSDWINRFSLPRENLGFNDRTYILSLSSLIKEKIRDRWNKVVAISSEYRTSYEDMVFKGQPETFRAFLISARQRYWSMAETLGQLEQTLIAWGQYTKSYPNLPLPYAQLLEFYGILRHLHVARCSSEIAA
jgi:hypothetical protein